MKGVPTDIGTIHFVGIGGIGMSGIAEVMDNLGYSVQGSDLAESASVLRLRERGIHVAIGHDAANLGNAAVVVTSTAVKRTNPEVAAALEARIPVVRRAEMLAELMRLKSTVAVAGTHGKTTTSSLLYHILAQAGLQPSALLGGELIRERTNCVIGASDILVVEADESDGSFVRTRPEIAVITSMDADVNVTAEAYEDCGFSKDKAQAAVEELFDQFASSFDETLVEKLGYRGHLQCAAVLSQALEDVELGADVSVVDLGAGTGLCGAPLRRVLAPRTPHITAEI